MSDKSDTVKEVSNFEVEEQLQETSSGEREQPPRKTSWVDLLAVFTAGCAFLSDGYQQSIISPVNNALSISYDQYSTGNWKTMVSNSNLVANIIGQVFFGLFVDRIGRRQGFAITTALIIIGSIVAACAKGSTQPHLFWMLIIARGVSGTGVGGEYPCSASAAMEAADERLGKRGKLAPFIFATNVPIAFGLPLASIVFLIVAKIWGEHNTSGIYRTCFALGAVIPLSIFAFRWRMHHAEVYKKNSIKRKVPYVLGIKRYWKSFLGVSGMWFLMDFVIYPNNVFSSVVIKIVIPKASLIETAEWQLLLGCFAGFGALLGIVLLRWMSRKQLIIYGFLGYGLVSIIVGSAFEQLSNIPALFIIFYALMNFLIYGGPCNLQSIVASETFPTFMRGTFYGVAAGIGKAGAAVGTEVFTPIQTKLGNRYTFFVSGGVCVLGAIVVYFLVPDTTEYDLAEEDEKFNQYLKDNGWTGHMGEGDNKIEFNA